MRWKDKSCLIKNIHKWGLISLPNAYNSFAPILEFTYKENLKIIITNSTRKTKH